MTDLLLYNGLTPLRRSPADVFLDNGIAMLRAYLKNAGIDFTVEDLISLDEIERFNVPDVSRPLRDLFHKQIYCDEPLPDGEKVQLDKLYSELLASHADRMDSYLDGLAAEIARRQILVVGIKLWAGSTFKYCKKFCEMIHERSPETVVVAGGPQVNCFSYEGKILKFTPFDLAVYSEGEVALTEIVKLCRTVNSKKERLQVVAAAQIPNLIYRDSDGIVVNPVSVVDVNRKHLPDYGDRAGKVPVHTIVDALGCDYGKCSFCIHPQIYPKFRKRDPKIVVDEIQTMIGQGIGLFSFTASDTPLSHAVKISEEVLRRNLNIEYTMLTRAKRNAFKHTEELVERFRILISAGLKSVFFGVESGNDAVLEHVMNKGIKTSDIVQTINCLREAAELERSTVNIIASFIYPVPLTQELVSMGVTLETVLEDNLALLEKIKPDSFHAAPGLLYAGTDWYTNKEKYGISFEEDDFDKRWIEQEFSYHGFVDLNHRFLYTFNETPFRDLVAPSMEFARKGNNLGIPSDLWEEQFIFARATGVEDPAKLQELSTELFLDLLVCFDEKTRYLYEAASKRSLEIAMGNAHVFGEEKK